MHDPPHVTSPFWGPPPPWKQALKLVKATQKLKKVCDITGDRTRDLGHRRQCINQPYHSWLLKNESVHAWPVIITSEFLAPQVAILVGHWPLNGRYFDPCGIKKNISPGITDFIVSLLSSVKSVRFPWLFTLKKMPANSKKILSPACVNKVLIGSFIISNDDGDGESTEKDKKAVSLD